MKWHELQKEFATSVRNPKLPPSSSIKPLKNGAPPVKRLNVYRNNVALSLINNLKDTYPTVCALVGDEFFNQMAKTFVDQHLPKSPVMHKYGGEFPAFIGNYDLVSNLKYLKDIASLEWAANIATHSRDCDPVSIKRLQDYSEQELPKIRFELHPSLHLIQSEWPIVSIWQAHQNENPDESLKTLPDNGEIALIIRPDLDVEIRTIFPSTYTFIEAITKQATFGEAVEKAVEKDENFNIAENLSGLFLIGAVSSIN